MTPSTTDTTIPAPAERSSEDVAAAESGEKRRRRRGGKRRHGSGGADGAAPGGAPQAPQAPQEQTAPAQASPASAYSGTPAPAAPAAAPEHKERSGGHGESRGRRDDRPRRDDRGGKGRSERDRGHGRDRGGQGVDESYKERKHVEQPAGPAPEVEIPAFAALGLEGRLLAGVAAMGYVDPTPIQEHAIPRVLAGRDVVGSAQTGTGKTAAFVLPILQNMKTPMIVDGKKAHPTALVVTPTRELCGQIEEVGERWPPTAAAASSPSSAAFPTTRRPSASARASTCSSRPRVACSTCSARATSCWTRSTRSCSTKPTACSTWASGRT